MYEFSKEFCNMGEILDLKDDTQIIFFTWKKVLFWEFFYVLAQTIFTS